MLKTLMACSLVVAATCAVADPVDAPDFRTLAYRASCENVTELEVAQGSSPLEGELPSGYEHAFRGRHLDRDVVIGYSCRVGTFYRGAYIFEAKDEADASALYRRLKQMVTKERGAPSYDFASREHREKMAAGDGAGHIAASD